jgi:hypothetical protein
MSNPQDSDDEFDEESRGSVRARLKYDLQSLAADAEIQLSLNPEWIGRVDELALSFEDSIEFAKIYLAAWLTEEQWAVLESIDRKLYDMSFGGSEYDEELWTGHSLRNHPSWSEIRILAKIALESLGWPCDPPQRT